MGDSVLLVAGLLALVGGAELLVRSGTRLAARLGVSPMVIGVTVVSIGTSAPELAIGIDAAAQGSGSLALGNIVGTNTLNLLLILGIAALIRPLTLRSHAIRLDLPAMVVAAVTLLLLCADGVVTRFDGALLVVLGVVYTTVIVRAARREGLAARTEFAREFGEQRARVAAAAARTRTVRDAVLLVAGIAIVVVGADWLVDGAVALAAGFGVPVSIIGLTIVAIGTSSPELVTAIVATIRRERDIAVGNLLGSSVFNILFIFGITSLIPADGIGVDRGILTIDLPVMVAATVACIPVFLTGRRMQRIEGAVFVVAYLAYLTTLLLFRA
ncbi:sodium:calcium antiporter [Agromyces luteolus]|uniref:Calcium/sodium antiporter n=1 Tax=Agromyces luteolus TaxID=88373 RepID=A0A7C9LRM0_9MICO|nr:calcium/sodium antiporter [Agromyces luteolus]MUN06076.1 calcium/sodium antiporter [Agromyces luteolus]GLK28886.1 sodium:calcium antiporter [Agromyces luteolus]